MQLLVVSWSRIFNGIVILVLVLSYELLGAIALGETFLRHKQIWLKFFSKDILLEIEKCIPLFFIWIIFYFR